MVKKILKPIIFDIFSEKEQIATARTNSHGQEQIATACGGPLLLYLDKYICEVWPVNKNYAVRTVHAKSLFFLIVYFSGECMLLVVLRHRQKIVAGVVDTGDLFAALVNNIVLDAGYFWRV